MANAPLHSLMAQLRRLAAPKAECALTDAELLARFTSAHDEAAFELLAWRYGAMVLSLCRRLLQQQQDIEDAFQATFLVFVRKAHAIRKREAVGSWLYKVAYRVAVRARAAAARRTRHEQQAADHEAVDPNAQLLWRDLRPVLDDEVNRLPERYRVPFILCYVEDKTIDEIARQLGCPRSTVANRLARARERLRGRLTRRGLVLPATFLTTVVSAQAASAAVPAALMGTTVHAATTAAAGKPLAGVVSARATALTRGVLQTMLMTKLKVGALFLALLAALAAAVGFLTRPVLNAQPRQPAARAKRPTSSQAARPPARRPQAKPAPGRLLFYRAGHLTLTGPDGKGSKQVSKNRGKFLPSNAWLSPDGKRIACLIQVDKKPVTGRDPPRKIYVRGLDGPEPGTDLEVEGQLVSWSPDGKHLIAVDPVYGKEGKDIKFVNWLVNVKTKEKTALKLPDNHTVLDWSRDGKHFLTAGLEMKKQKPPTARLYLMKRDGTKARALTDKNRPVFFGRLSPDGRQLLYLAPDPQRKEKERRANPGLFLMDIARRKSMRVQQQPLNGDIMGFSWSPDGKRIAYTWRQVHDKPKPQQETESHLVVADPDGKNPVTIATEKGGDTGVITIGWIDWR